MGQANVTPIDLEAMAETAEETPTTPEVVETPQADAATAE
jgi:hypothetical protein